MKKRALLNIAVAVFILSTSGVHAQKTGEIHAIVELRESCVIGGAQDQRWVDARRLVKSLKPSEKLNRYTLQGPAGDFTISKVSQSDCPGEWSLESTSNASDGIAIASPTWPVMPRTPRPIDRKDKTYVNVVAEILNSLGVKKPGVDINEG